MKSLLKRGLLPPPSGGERDGILHEKFIPSNTVEVAALVQVVNPVLSLLDSLKCWKDIAASLREPPRRRAYQHDELYEKYG